MVALYFFGGGNFDQIPGFVYGILFGYVFFFNTFPINMALQVRVLLVLLLVLLLMVLALTRLVLELVLVLLLLLVPFLMLVLTTINMALQYGMVGKWRDYRYGEKWYIILSLASKSLLTWLVFGGTFQPNGN